MVKKYGVHTYANNQKNIVYGMKFNDFKKFDEVSV